MIVTALLVSFTAIGANTKIFFPYNCVDRPQDTIPSSASREMCYHFVSYWVTHSVNVNVNVNSGSILVNIGPIDTKLGIL